MKKQSLIFLFFLLLAADVIGIEINSILLQYITKPLLMPLLALFFVFNIPAHASPLKKWILAALFFSWAGDVLLMFQDKIPDFFLFGLSAFLLAHLFYIIFFHSIRVKEGVKGRIALLLPVAVYYAGLIFLLSPNLGEMKMPVVIYGLVISFMLVLALHMLFIRKREAGQQLATGAILFVISDSVLAINKFYIPFDFASLAIMLTYGLAQYLIIRGACLYLSSGRQK